MADLYRALFERNSRPMWVCDRATLAIRLANDAACRLYGWSRDELCAMTLAQLWAPDDAGGLEPAIPRLARHVTRDGAVIRVELDALEVELDGAPAVVVTATDITATWMQRFAAEKSLEGMAVIDADADYTLRYLSPGAERLLGRLRRARRQTVDAGRSSRGRARPREEAAGRRIHDARAAPRRPLALARDAADQSVATSPASARYVTNYRDITRRIEAERALRETQSPPRVPAVGDARRSRTRRAHRGRPDDVHERERREVLG